MKDDERSQDNSLSSWFLNFIEALLSAVLQQNKWQKRAFSLLYVSAELLEREYLVPFFQILGALLKEISAFIASISGHEMPKSMLLFVVLWCLQ